MAPDSSANGVANMSIALGSACLPKGWDRLSALNLFHPSQYITDSPRYLPDQKGETESVNSKTPPSLGH